MNFEVSSNSLDRISSDGIVVFAFEGKNTIIPTSWLTFIDKALRGILLEGLKTDLFKAKVGELYVLDTHKKILATRVYVLGLGKKEEFDGNKLRRAMSLFAKNTKKKISSVAISTLEPSEANLNREVQAQMIAEGLLLGSYSFNKYLSSKDKEKQLEVVIFSEDNKNTALKIKEGVKLAELYSTATKIARDLINEPASLITPTFLANMALDIAKKNTSVRCTVYDKAQIEKMGMGAFLGVAQASDTPPKFIHLEYTPKASSKKQKLAIVGKGITFDSGGISIKTGDSMQTMKCDMAGAATVLGVFSVISQIKPSFPVMGIIAATPNLISGKSLVPGDILRAMNGKTIEVLNTDAEGRVTLADSISYALKKGATEIIDLATLTGACMIALGTDMAALFSNNNQLKERVEKAAEEAGEKVWELPLEKEYKDLNKSEVADISNIPSTRYGGAVTAALFLEEFVDNKPWVHLDIAGPAFYDKAYDLGPKGGSGFGVRTLLNLLRSSSIS